MGPPRTDGDRMAPHEDATDLRRSGPGTVPTASLSATSQPSFRPGSPVDPVLIEPRHADPRMTLSLHAAGEVQADRDAAELLEDEFVMTPEEGKGVQGGQAGHVDLVPVSGVSGRLLALTTSADQGGDPHPAPGSPGRLIDPKARHILATVSVRHARVPLTAWGGFVTFGLGVFLVGCSQSSFSGLTGRVSFVGQRPVTGSGEQIVVSQGKRVVARQLLKPDGSFRLSIGPGTYTLTLAGPMSGTPPSNVAVVRAGETTNKNLTYVIFGSAPK